VAAQDRVRQRKSACGPGIPAGSALSAGLGCCSACFALALLAAFLAAFLDKEEEGGEGAVVVALGMMACGRWACKQPGSHSQ
jgi:hypothetical protein